MNLRQAALYLGLALSMEAQTASSFAPAPAFLSRTIVRNQKGSTISNEISGIALRSTMDAPSDVEDSDVEFEFESGDASAAKEMTLDPSKIRDEMLYAAKSLSEESPTGIFITTPLAMDKLSTVVKKLESIALPSSARERDLMVGDWELVATSRSIKAAKDAAERINIRQQIQNFPFKAPKLADSLRNSVTVLQRIQKSTPALEPAAIASDDTTTADNDDKVEVAYDSGVIDRVDHVIQYTPITLSDFIPENSLFNPIRSWNVNPLEVSKSQITLIHDAQIQELEPTIRTKIALKSVVVNVAGKSQYLDPKGADILGLNIPSLGDFATNSGSFDTTYIDENVRISRGTIGFLDEVRVFVRQGYDYTDIMEAGYETETLAAEEKEKTEVEIRMEKIGTAVSGVVGAVENLDKDVRGVIGQDAETVGKAVGGVRDSIKDAVGDVQSVVEGDLKKVTKAVDNVRAAVVGTVAAENDAGVLDVEAEIEAEAETDDDMEGLAP